MEWLYPTSCINKVSHLERKRQHVDYSNDLPDLKRLKINETVKENIHVEEKSKAHVKIELIEQKMRFFKIYIDHLQNELNELKNIID